MKQLKEYFRLQAEIYSYFGYEEDWVVIPLEDNTDDFWSLSGEGRGDELTFSPDKTIMEKFLEYDRDWETAGIGDKIYTDEIYTQRFLPKWVYRGKDFTMVCVDTHTDGNKFLRVFDNAKEVKNDEV